MLGWLVHVVPAVPVKVFHSRGLRLGEVNCLLVLSNIQLQLTHFATHRLDY